MCKYMCNFAVFDESELSRHGWSSSRVQTDGTPTTSTTTTTSGDLCAVAEYKGDGYCDDANNVAACDFDGGDCCDGVGSE
jgi:hypothetical protein